MLKRRFTLKTAYVLVTCILFSLIVGQLFSLQIVNGARFDEISRRNYVRIIRVNALRGEILDEKLRPIVTNRPSVNLYFRPILINDRKSLIEFLTSKLTITPEFIERLIFDNRFRSSDEVLIAENLPENILALIAEEMNYFPELILKPESLRLYNIPNHFTGYVGKINERELQRYRGDDYTLHSIVGKNGLESYYEGLLAGKPGYEIMQVDALGRSLNLFRHGVHKPPVNGFNVVLTINIELQEYIRSIFPEDKAGAVVVMNPKTGGILSYNSFPEYDQNWFSSGISHAQWTFLNEHELKPLIDRVTMGTYPPGSTYKILSTAFGLEKNYVNEHTKLANCDGGMQIGNRYFKCWLQWGHGRSNLYDAMAVSCDVYYYDLSARFNLDEFSRFNHANFIHARTGVDLPIERAGFFPDSDWYRRRMGRFFSATGAKANLVIGQGETLTSPLAVCAYYAAIANDGIWLSPHFFQRAFNDEAVINTEFFTKTSKPLPISSETLAILQRTLYDAVYRSDGTARQARVPGVEVYGKTGSSENHQGDLTHASYAGYAIWDTEPEIAFYVIVENAGSGGSVAGPIVRKIITFYDEIRSR
jgi:penicillin-binding protein 2